jgi:hypothetical protein
MVLRVDVVSQVAIRAGERERREVMMELMESTLYPQTESFSIDLGLDLIQPAAKKPQEQVRGLSASASVRQMLYCWAIRTS